MYMYKYIFICNFEGLSKSFRGKEKIDREEMTNDFSEQRRESGRIWSIDELMNSGGGRRMQEFKRVPRTNPTIDKKRGEVNV